MEKLPLLELNALQNLLRNPMIHDLKEAPFTSSLPHLFYTVLSLRGGESQTVKIYDRQLMLLVIAHYNIILVF